MRFWLGLAAVVGQGCVERDYFVGDEGEGGGEEACDNEDDEGDEGDASESGEEETGCEAETGEEGAVESDAPPRREGAGPAVIDDSSTPHTHRTGRDESAARATKETHDAH